MELVRLYILTIMFLIVFYTLLQVVVNEDFKIRYLVSSGIGSVIVVLFLHFLRG